MKNFKCNLKKEDGSIGISTFIVADSKEEVLKILSRFSVPGYASEWEVSCNDS